MVVERVAGMVGQAHGHNLVVYHSSEELLFPMVLIFRYIIGVWGSTRVAKPHSLSQDHLVRSRNGA